MREITNRIKNFRMMNQKEYVNSRIILLNKEKTQEGKILQLQMLLSYS